MDPYRPNPKRSGWVSVLYPAVTASSAIWTGFHPVEPGPDPLGPPPDPSGRTLLDFEDFGKMGKCDFSRFTVNPEKVHFLEIQEEDRILEIEVWEGSWSALGIEVR